MCVRRASTVLGVCLAAAAIVSAPASGGGMAGASSPIKVLRAKSGAVRAELSYRERNFAVRDVRLRIFRRGTTVLERAIPEVRGQGAGRPVSLVIRRLDSGEPEVVFDYFTGGAYCCSVSQIYRHDAAGKSYRRTIVDWGSLGYRLVDLGSDGRPELVSGDLRLDQAFTAHVLSSAPIRIWRYRSGRLADVTRRFPAQVAAHLRDARRTYLRGRRERVDLRGIAVAYVGDLYLLGRPAEAQRVLAEGLRRGDFDRTQGTRPRGEAYVRALLARLRKAGYIRSGG
jgi:hypothetical protein